MGPVTAEAGILRHAAARRSGPIVDSLARRALLLAASRGTRGAIELTEAGRTCRLGTGELIAEVAVVDPATYGAVLRSGSVGLGASYVAGWWDSGDLTTLVRVLYRDTRRWRSLLDRVGRMWGRALDLPARLMGPDRDDDRRNVSDHYDLSNEFFALMLDETMSYSCVFVRP